MTKRENPRMKHRFGRLDEAAVYARAGAATGRIAGLRLGDEEER
ncbi:MAG: hypothetical protein ACREM3_29380 [Candidatus Rokuibacteriota bacterium]